MNEGHWALTTADNPYNPNGGEDEFRQWNQFDISMGYYTLSYLARVVRSSDELSEASQQFAYDLAVEEILELNLTGNYIRIDKDGKPVETSS
jgi:hypothetical protein